MCGGGGLHSERLDDHSFQFVVYNSDGPGICAVFQSVCASFNYPVPAAGGSSNRRRAGCDASFRMLLAFLYFSVLFNMQIKIFWLETLTIATT